jgi:hypothetical protein
MDTGVKKLMSDMKYCYNCGTKEPEYKIVGNSRICGTCRFACVMSVTEMLGVVSDLSERGMLPAHFITEHTDEEFDMPDLDFEEDEQDVLRAELDAYSDIINDFKQSGDYYE